LLVHIGDPSSNQATTLESQMIHMIQELFGQTLRLSASLGRSSLPLRRRDRRFKERKAGKNPDRYGREWNSRDWASVCSSWATEEESKMPVLLLWAVPAVIVVGGVGYYLVRAVH
jgi:hypothetical protein